MWTQFMDMHSGGGSKEKWSQIFIEAPEDEAKVIFYNRFHHNPERVTCTCCGEDYSITENASLEELTDYWRRDASLDEYVKRQDVLVIHDEEIKPEEKIGDVPTEGFIWV